MSNNRTNTQVFITKLDECKKGHLIGEWLPLPCNKEQLNDALRRIGIGLNEEYFITDYETDIEGWYVCNEKNILELSNIIEKVEVLNEDDYIKLQALLEWNCHTLKEAFEKLNSTTLLKHINTEYELGEHFYIECYGDKVPERMQPYLDMEVIGENILDDGNGSLTSFGFVEIH